MPFLGEDINSVQLQDVFSTNPMHTLPNDDVDSVSMHHWPLCLTVLGAVPGITHVMLSLVS